MGRVDFGGPGVEFTPVPASVRGESRGSTPTWTRSSDGEFRMTTATWVTMIVILSVVWGGCALTILTAIRKESDK